MIGVYRKRQKELNRAFSPSLLEEGAINLKMNFVLGWDLQTAVNILNTLGMYKQTNKN